MELPIVFRGSVAVASGALTRGQLRGPAVRRLCRDTYTIASRRVTHELRCRAVALALPEGAVITGRSAATIRGVPLAWPDDDVQVLAPPEMRLGHRTGLIVRRTEIEDLDWHPWAGGRIASPLRMALDVLLGQDLPEAVAGLDALLRRKLVTKDVIGWMVTQRSDNGIVLARRAVELADPRAGAPPESKLRVLLVTNGFRPVPQFWIEDHTGRLSCVDLALPEHKIAIEYDGDWRDGEAWALNHDRDRLNRVHAAGWEVIFVTAPMLHTPQKVLALVRAAVAQRTSEP